jgi:DNA-3-methyladenine glycosylase II
MSRKKAFEHFKEHDAVLYKAALPFYETLPERLYRERDAVKLFATLCSSIIGQQLSTKAAETIRLRLLNACDGSITPEKISALDAHTMRSLGISEAKIRSIKELAHAVIQKEINLQKLYTVKEEEARRILCRLRGIGPWTADMFLMFALGRDDVFSAGDLGLVLSLMELDGVAERPSVKKIDERTEVWAPYRTWAALMLWKIRDAQKPEKKI